MDEFHRGYEAEEIFPEEDPLRVLKRLEEEGWIKHLFPTLSSAKANVAELERLRDSQTQLQLRGIHPEVSAANFPLLTAKMAPKEVSALKKSFARPGFVAEIEGLEGEAKEFAAPLPASCAANSFASPSSPSISATNPGRAKLFFSADTSLGAIFAVSSGKLAAETSG